MKPTALNGITALALAAMLLPACSKPQPIPWDAETEFRFGGLMQDEAPYVEQVFRSHDLAFRRTSESPISYKVAGITTVRDLAYVHRDLRAVAREQRISMPLETATLNFGGLAASGSVLTRITVSVSAGARALVADRPVGSPWRLVDVNRQGKWEGLVNTKGIVAQNGGWVYIAAVGQDITRYYRVNVLTKQQEYVPYADLRKAGLFEPTPEDMNARPSSAQPDSANQINKPQADEEKESSGGFKWPWEK